MTLTQLKYIVETAKAGTISRAAEKLYISPTQSDGSYPGTGA